MKRCKRVCRVLVLLFVLFLCYRSDDALAESQNGSWIRSGAKWWYLYSDGSYPANEWDFIDGKYYYFDKNGYMSTGWIKDNGKWYYLSNSGAMSTGWIKDDDKWYYLAKNGSMDTGWQYISQTWYYFKQNGAMSTGWLQLGNSWYHLGYDGAMKTGWVQSNGAYYYFAKTGAMMTSQWIGHNYVLSNGKMAVNQWISNDYVDAAGNWVVGDEVDRVYTIDLGNGKTTTVVGHFDTIMSNEIFNSLNTYRSSKGLSVLNKPTKSLQTIANIRAFEIAYSYSHTRPNNESCSSLYNDLCIDTCVQSQGENIAAGYWSADSVMNGWKNSPGHNRNMLGKYSTIGISVFSEKVADSFYRNYFVQYFVL